MSANNDLRSDVLDELLTEPTLDSSQIGVAINNGIVSLSGHVPTYVEKHVAENAASRVEGVKGVADELEVHRPQSSQPTDTETTAVILRALKLNSFVPEERVKVIVDHGWVTLEGDVTFSFQKQEAETAVRFLPGVRGITNSLAVKSMAEADSVEKNI